MKTLILLILVISFNTNAMTMTTIPEDDGEGFYLVMKGNVIESDVELLEYVLRDKPITRIVLMSRGGNVYAGLGMGDIISSLGIPTFALNYCHSACNFIFIAGKSRHVILNSIVGLHNPYYKMPDIDFLGAIIKMPNVDAEVNTEIYWDMYKSFIKSFRGDERLAHMWVAKMFDTDSELLFHINQDNAKEYGCVPLL